MQSYDVLVVGGGIIGSAVAYFLAASEKFSGTVAVVERDPAYKLASTPRSCGGIRQQFSTHENVQIGLFGYEFVTNVSKFLTVDDVVPDLGWQELGYLFLAGKSGVKSLRQNHIIQHTLGANIKLLSPAELKRAFPWLKVDDLALGSFGISGEGWLDPNSLLMAFRAKARSLGVTYIEGDVIGISKQNNKVEKVHLADGQSLLCDTLVNAAGSFAGQVANFLGIQLPVVPKKRNVYVFSCREILTPRVPLLIDISGTFVRSEGHNFVCGTSPPVDRDPDAWDDLDVDYFWFEEIVWPAIASRIPAFESIKLTNAWAGWYDFNTFDQNGVIGFHPEIANFMFANGFSGHGLQQSPAVGRAVMELITTGTYQSIDLTRFKYERILSGNPLSECNIV